MWDFNLCICWPVSLVIKYNKCVRICEMCPFGHVAVDVCLLLCDQCIGQIMRFLCKEHYQKLRTVIRTTYKTNVSAKCWHNQYDGDPIEKQGHLDRGLGTSSREWPPGLPRVVDLLAFWYPVTTPQPWTLNGWVAFGSWHEVRIFLDFQGILCCIPVMSAVEARRDLEVED